VPAKELGGRAHQDLRRCGQEALGAFPDIDLATHIEWTEFYLADALIVSGKMTGAAPDIEKVRQAKELATRPVLLGSGT